MLQQPRRIVYVLENIIDEDKIITTGKTVRQVNGKEVAMNEMNVAFLASRIQDTVVVKPTIDFDTPCLRASTGRFNDEPAVCTPHVKNTFPAEIDACPRHDAIENAFAALPIGKREFEMLTVLRRWICTPLGMKLGGEFVLHGFDMYHTPSVASCMPTTLLTRRAEGVTGTGEFTPTLPDASIATRSAATALGEQPQLHTNDRTPEYHWRLDEGARPSRDPSLCTHPRRASGPGPQRSAPHASDRRRHAASRVHEDLVQRLSYGGFGPGQPSS